MCASALPVVLPNDGSGTGSARLRRANAHHVVGQARPPSQCSQFRRTAPAHDAGSRGEPVQARPPCTSTSAATRPVTGSARPRRATAQGIAYTLGLRQRVQRRDGACLSAPSIRVRFRCDETRHRLGASAPSPCSRCRRARPRPRWLAVQLGGLLGAGPRAGARPRPMRARRGRNRAAPSPRRRRAGDAAGRSRRVIGFANPSRPAILLRIGATSPTCPVQSGPHLPRESIPLPCSTRGGPVSAASASVVAFSRHQPRSTGLRMRDVRRPGGSPVPSSAPVRSMLVAASGRGKRGAGSVARLQAEATTRRRKGLSVTKG